MKHIVSFSGGKDSTAMLLKMIELNMQIDEIVFCDTGIEFPEMYDHIGKVEKYIGRKITKVKSEKSFEYYLYKHKKRSKKNKSLGYGFPRMNRNRWCTTKLKQQPFDRYLKNKYEKEKITRYIGIAADESRRIRKYKYPLAEWGITEKEALEYCYTKGFDFGNLYRKFKRASCWCCPQQGLSELKNLYRYYPKYWEKLKLWESKTYNNFRCDYTLLQLEQRFKREVFLERNQLTMFKEEDVDG